MSPRRQAPHRGAADRLPGGAGPAPVVGYRFWRLEAGERGAVLRSLFSTQACTAPIVQHGCEGWRAAFARPVALLDTGHPLLEAAARRYRISLLSERGLRLLAREHGDELAGP